MEWNKMDVCGAMHIEWMVSFHKISTTFWTNNNNKYITNNVVVAKWLEQMAFKCTLRYAQFYCFFNVDQLLIVVLEWF